MLSKDAFIALGKTPPPPPIAEGTSIPCDSTAPSLLTTIPAEVRNAIYDTLFHVPSGIRMCFGYCGPEFEDQELGEDLASGLALLSTCRQIYQEAATTLFSNNTWIMSRCPTRMHHMSINAHIIELTGAACMLQMFGSRKMMVKNILLDLDMTCPVPCALHRIAPELQNNGGGMTGGEWTLELWTLMTELFHLPDLKVQFVHPKRRPYFDLHPTAGFGQVDLGLHLSTLNNILHTLREDAIGIRKYGRQVQHVRILRDCTQGYVLFHMPGPMSGHTVGLGDTVQLGFVISHGGRTFNWAELERTPPTLANLPRYSRDKILDEVAFRGINHSGSNGVGVVWDLDKKTLTGASLVGGAICQKIRKDYYRWMWINKHIILKMGTSQTRSDFKKFENLIEFSPQRSVTHHNPYHDRFQTSHVTLLLEFNTPSDVSAEDIRVNISHLLQVTIDLCGSTKVTVSLPGRKDEPRAEATMNLWMCRASMLTALSDAGNRVREIHWMSPHPAVWMNGRLEVVEVEKDNLSGPSEEDDYL